jgi:uncharacterized membrane protein YgaE (UPF0421/DUF939 family)
MNKDERISNPPLIMVHHLKNALKVAIFTVLSFLLFYIWRCLRYTVFSGISTIICLDNKNGNQKKVSR